MTQDDADRWIGHTPMTDPAGHAPDLVALPVSIGALNAVVQGLLIHSEYLADYGLGETAATAATRTTLPVRDRIDDILSRDGRPLHRARPPAARSLGTCRDFALLLCSILRAQGTASRLRCGFAAYLGGGWEDHWVCEVWDARTRTWRLSDAQVDPMLAGKYRIDFDPADVPRDRFVTAGEAWAGVRSGRLDPGRFGHGATTGLWFLKVNVIRDHYVLNGRERSAWDGWRAAPDRVVSGRDDALLDRLAHRPGQPLLEIAPDWLALP